MTHEDLEKLRLFDEVVAEGRKLLARGINPVITTEAEAMEKMKREMRNREERLNALRRKMEKDERSRPYW